MSFWCLGFRVVLRFRVSGFSGFRGLGFRELFKSRGLKLWFAFEFVGSRFLDL